MKAKSFLMYTLMLCMSVVFTACEETITHFNFFSNKADFMVKNLSTGETGKNLGTDLNVKNGDVLELIYTPEDDYSKYRWSAKFELFDETKTVSKSPYSCQYTIRNAVPGSYYISCYAVITGEDIIFSGFDAGVVKVKVTE